LLLVSAPFVLTAIAGALLLKRIGDVNLLVE